MENEFNEKRIIGWLFPVVITGKYATLRLISGRRYYLFKKISIVITGICETNCEDAEWVTVR